MPRAEQGVVASMSQRQRPSGLERWLKAPFRKGVGSNPTAVTFLAEVPARTAIAAWPPDIAAAMRAHEETGQGIVEAASGAGP